MRISLDDFPAVILTDLTCSQSTTATTTTSRIFTVPDSDNEDEIVSVHSRESSVQILESNIRTTTYSVPSDSDYGSDSDDFGVDDDDFAASSVRPKNSEDSAVTTPEQHIIRASDETMPKSEGWKGKTLDLNLKGPKLHDVIAKAAHEGSSQNHPIDLADKNLLDEEANRFTVDVQQNSLEDMQIGLVEEVDSDETESEDEGPEVLPIQPKTKRSDIAALLNEKPIAAHETSAETMFDAGAPNSDSADVDESQIERIIQETQRRVAKDEAEDGVVSLNVAESSIAGTTGAVAGSDVDDEEGEEEEDDIDDAFPSDFDEANEFDSPALFDSRVEKPKEAPALPMPSEISSPEAFLLQRAPSPSDAALARTSSNLGSMPRRSAMCPTDFPSPTANTKFPDPSSHTWHSAPPVTDYPLWRDIPMPPCRYNPGPFPENAVNAPFSSIDPTTQGSGPSVSHGHYEDMLTNRLLSPPDLPLQELPIMRTAEDQSSKLQISNLVNSYYAEPSCSNKRKAAEISVDAEDLEFDTARSRLPATSQETLPDAQPRDAPIVTETSISLGETIEPSGSSITTTVATETSPSEEPAPKRAKKSSSASGIGKFLIGVGVGAVGLAATFLATIPAHVQEEVRLGL